MPDDTDDESPQELFLSLAEAHHTQALAQGWQDVDTDSETASAARHAGQSEAFDTAASLVEETDDQVGLHEFEHTVTTSKLVSHPDRELFNFEVDASHRDVFEESVLCEGVEVIDDQTIEVTLIVDLPEEL